MVGWLRGLLDRVDPSTTNIDVIDRRIGQLRKIGALADAALAAGRLGAARRLFHGVLAGCESIRTAPLDGSPEHSARRAAAIMLSGGYLSSLADVEQADGNGRRAMELLHEAADRIHEAFPGSVSEAMLIHRIGVAHFDLDEFVEAVDAHERALVMLDDPAPIRCGDYRPAEPDEGLALRATVLSSLGNAYFRAGNRERAVQLVTEAIDELPAAALGRPPEANCRSNAGGILVMTGHPAAAREHLERALLLERQVPDVRPRLTSLNNLGQACLELGDLARARELLAEAQEIIRGRRVRGTPALVVLNNAEAIRARTGEPGAYRHDRLQAFLDSGQGGAAETPELAWAFANLAGSLLEAHLRGDAEADPQDLEAAVRAAERGVEIAEAIRAQLPTPIGREQLSERLQAPYQALITALYLRGDPDAHASAFRVAELSCGRGLADTFVTAVAARRPPPASEQERRLRRRHARLRRKLVDPRRRAELAPAELGRLSSSERRLAWQVETALRDRFGATRPTPVAPDLASAQRALGPDTLLLCYEVNATGVFAWSVRRNDAELRRLSDDGRRVAELVAAAAGSGRGADPTTPDQQAARRELGQILLGSLPAGHIREAAHIVVIPGVLGLLPLEMLPLGEGPTDRLLADVAPVSYLPSVATLLELRSRPLVPKPRVEFLGVAPGHPDQPLPAARREVSAAAARFASARLLIGPDATEDTVLDGLAHCRYLHLACHGYVDAEQPLQSGLIVDLPACGPVEEEPGEEGPGDEGADGVLPLHALLDTWVQAELVVLSGCNTGLGRLREGEGMVGFATAFLGAGARRLVLTLWPVVDGRPRG